MSQRLLFADLKTPQARISAALNVCADDPRFVGWANEFQERALNQGRWLGSVQECQFCVTDGCFTFPRQVAVVERLAVCGQPITMQNEWFPFTRLLSKIESCSGCSSGCGSQGGSCSCGHLHFEDRGYTGACSFATTRGAARVIRSYCMSVSDVGKKLVFQGRDQYGTWVRTNWGGSVQDGEQVTLAMPFVDTVTLWGPGSPAAVIKDATTARVLVYSYDPGTTSERALANYEPSETRPNYRTGFVPHFSKVRCQPGCTDAAGDNIVTVTALVSLQHIPIESDNDWLIFQNLSAYKAGMIAMKAYEEGDPAKGNFYFYGSESGARNARGVTRVLNRGGAIPMLEAELRKATGDRVNCFVTLDESNKFPRIMAGFR